MMWKRQDGFTLLELLIVVAIIGIIAAIAVPSLLRARQAGNESSAIGALRGIGSAQSAYAATCGNGFYSPSLQNLGVAPGGIGEAFISADIGVPGPVVKSGYLLTLRGTAAAGAPPSCNGLGPDTTVSGYNAIATPQSGAGVRHFATNVSLTIWNHTADLSSITDEGPPGAGVPLQ